ncbi:Group 1 truncated hemoglobin GlbN [Caballeronia catudaia]|uniref:Group 1 truncated hemoglobin GlbN n=1 Tax=Caballeronia catudaia TaxID=1777136 RepID=A0A158AI55_9BURK|nr:group 1 truncated hemoglobin [Caballeronia catudaia]SAK57405.1 Group 1 truncated hemoglobin GlbN [Caballeronia catudaia]
MIKMRHAALLVLTFACANARADDALYKQFGEKDGLTKIVDDMYDNVLSDPRTAPWFDSAPVVRIKQKLVEQLCVLLDGPCVYTGRDMKRTHAGQNIDRVAFNALVEDLQAAMDKNGVSFHAQNKLLAKLAPMYREVQDRE